MKTVTISDYKTGDVVGKAEMTQGEWEQYIREARGPEMVVRADILAPEERIKLGLADGQSIFIEE